MSRKSTFEVESLIRKLDTLNISQKDSSSVIVKMSPEFRPTEENPVLTSAGTVIKSSEAMGIKSVNAQVRGYSILDLGHAQIDSLTLQIEDSSAIILSGGALKKK
jgi:hypothetical protein